MTQEEIQKRVSDFWETTDIPQALLKYAEGQDGIDPEEYIYIVRNNFEVIVNNLMETCIQFTIQSLMKERTSLFKEETAANYLKQDGFDLAVRKIGEINRHRLMK